MLHRSFVGLTLAAGLLAAPMALQAQGNWQTEIGIRAGFYHLSAAGSSTTYSLWDLPNGSGAGVSVPPSSLYGIVPLQGRFALEIGAGVSDVAAGGGNLTTLSLAPRLDAALDRHVYVALGPTMSAFRQAAQSVTQWGVALGTGYRVALTPHLAGRVELSYEHRFESAGSTFPKTDLLGVQLGVSAAFGSSSPAAAAHPARGAAVRSPEAPAIWTPALVVSGGYTNAFSPGNGSLSFLSAPGIGSGGATFIGVGAVIMGPPALSAIIPVGGRFAVEPNFDLHVITPSTGSGFTTYQLGARVDYALTRHFYVAAGAAYGAATSASTTYDQVAGTLAIGLRFPVAMGVGGRIEYNYMNWNGDGNIIPALQTNSLMVGIAAPLK